jgi:hypothetical protein
VVGGLDVRAGALVGRLVVAAADANERDSKPAADVRSPALGGWLVVVGPVHPANKTTNDQPAIHRAAPPTGIW